MRVPPFFRIMPAISDATGVERKSTTRRRCRGVYGSSEMVQQQINVSQEECYREHFYAQRRDVVENRSKNLKFLK